MIGNYTASERCRPHECERKYDGTVHAVAREHEIAYTGHQHRSLGYDQQTY